MWIGGGFNFNDKINFAKGIGFLNGEGKREDWFVDGWFKGVKGLTHGVSKGKRQPLILGKKAVSMPLCMEKISLMNNGSFFDIMDSFVSEF